MILAIIQARYSSTRLPGKVLKNIISKPMLLHQVERVKNSKFIDKLIVATSNHYTDKKIINLCNKKNINVFSGNLNNVLKRFYKVYELYRPSHIVRMTADCPLLYSKLVDKLISIHLKNNNDYTSNRGFISNVDGLDIEIFKSKLLLSVYKKAYTKYDKEHVTSFMYNNLKNIKKQFIDLNYRLSQYKLSVDNEVDFKFVNKIFINYKNKTQTFNCNDIYKFLKK